MIDEIRSYHYAPELFDEYKAWAVDHAVPYLKQHLNLVGFWLDAGIAPEIAGERPTEMPLGSANVTWIIRWESMELRAGQLGSVFGSDEFQEIFKRIPDPKGYLQMESRFAQVV